MSRPLTFNLPPSREVQGLKGKGIQPEKSQIPKYSPKSRLIPDMQSEYKQNSLLYYIKNIRRTYAIVELTPRLTTDHLKLLFTGKRSSNDLM